MSSLSLLDWSLVVLYLLFTLGVGLYYRNQAGKSLSEFFLGGRRLPWHIAGISMVATTFAADTPLWVTEKIYQYGVSGNWIWWNLLIGGMLATFFFSKLWRRAGIVTELELIEMRYSGKPAAFLRGFKSVYMGVFLNCVVIGWVNAAMIAILQVFFGLEAFDALLLVGGLMLLVALYSSLSGLIGVAITDAVQFVLAMGGCLVLAIIVVNSEEIGGITGLKEKLPEWRFDFFPSLSADGTSTLETYSLSIAGFLAFGAVQWWASWYPGAEPGGGGYVSQRMMSTKSEKDSMYATLFFNIAHYALRPWPWIVVGLCALVLYPELVEENAKNGFVMAMTDFLPNGLRGLLFVAFLAAYMSTISTQLNWGSSYLTNDLYKRFILRPEKREDLSEDALQRKYVFAARWFTLLIMVVALGVTPLIDTVDAAASFLIECGAGLGAVLILRWYWWRINVWSEISATLAPFLGYVLAHFVFPSEFPYSLFITAGTTTVIWIIVTFLTPPTDADTLIRFYTKVRPGGRWKRIADQAGIKQVPFQAGWLVASWISAVVFTYSVLFMIGKMVFAMWPEAGLWAASAAVSAVVLKMAMDRSGILLK